jgi:phenylalanyl-tRNA synthetase beta subunit
MLISYNWTKEYFKKLPKPEKLVDILNKRAFEIEGLEEKKLSNGEVDWIIDADVLPNRAHDALCHYGMAKEISTITGLKLIEKEIPAAPVTGKSDFDVKVNAQSTDAYGKKVDVCRRYIAREIKNISVTDSPDELRLKMESIGQKSINNIVDITNIVMFELNQPMHAFDANKISGNTIFVRNAKDDEEITTLDNQEIKLNKENPVIADSEKALAVAGVKGGKKAEVDANTTDIVLESANFHPTIVRKTSKQIGVKTESSKRFENEISPVLAERAIEIATDLILKYASTNETAVCASIEYYPRPIRNYRTGVSVSEINNLLGLNLNEGKVKKILEALKFEYEIVNPRDKIVVEARNNLGKPYKYGASVLLDAPNEFDCASFVAYVYSVAGISIPRISIDQFVSGDQITRDQLRPGDLIFGNNEKLDDYRTESVEFLPGTKVAGGIDHVGIYIGGDEVLHASRHNNSGVEISKIDEHTDFTKNIKFARHIEKEEIRFAVKVPFERLDIKNKNDLIEEIARVYGYEKIADRPIGDLGFSAKLNKKYAINSLIRKTLIEEGFSEIITYSFVEKGEVTPEKPIADDKGFLRTNLAEGMEKSLEKNVRNADYLGLDKIKTFEIGTVFSKKDNVESEKMMLSIGITNKIGVKKPTPANTIREVIEKIAGAVPGFDKDGILKKVKDDTSVIEINLTELYEKISEDDVAEMEYVDFPTEISDKYTPISQYPFILRDIAVWIPSDIAPEKLLKIIEKESGELLIRTTMFDVYEKDDRTSYAYRLVFQSHEKTLTDDEINPIMESITQKITDKKWEVR